MATTTTGISHGYLPSKNVGASIAFYTEQLGFTLQRHYRMGEREAAYVELGGVLVELTSSETTPADVDRVEPRLGVGVPDIATAIAELRAAGVTIVREPWAARTFWGLQAQIADPSGWVISLREWQDGDGPTFRDWTPRHDDVVRLA
jgi:predicted enzyme related to lactoylglutathione lyase